MAGKAIGSADELNIDSFFGKQSGGDDTVAKESETGTPDASKKAPEEKVDKKPDKKNKKQTDVDSEDDIDLEDESEEDEDLVKGKKQADDDSDDDIDLEDEDDSDEEDLGVKKKKVDVSKELDALSKKAINAETQRAQMQSERDSYKAQFEKASSSIESLTEKFEQLTQLIKKSTKKTEQSDTQDIFTGDDNALTTEGQFKKAYEKLLKLVQKSEGHSEEEDRPLTTKEAKRLLDEREKALSKSKTQEQPKIGSDQEAEKFWADSQPDAAEVSNYYSERKNALDPELATVPSLDGRYNAIRVKMKESELKSIKKAYKKLKQKINRMEKGELPETASGNRRKPAIDEKREEDPLVTFLSRKSY